jgi:hypothetical protein
VRDRLEERVGDGGVVVESTTTRPRPGASQWLESERERERGLLSGTHRVSKMTNTKRFVENAPTIRPRDREREVENIGADLV